MKTRSIQGLQTDEAAAVHVEDSPSADVLALHGVDGIDPESVRFLGEHDAALHWAAVDYAGNICVLTRLAQEDVFGSACNTPESVEKHGLAVGAFNDPNSDMHQDVTAILLPDSAKAPAAAENVALRTADLPEDAAPWEVVTPNLVVADTSDIENGETYTFERSSGDGADVEFNLDGHSN